MPDHSPSLTEVLRAEILDHGPMTFRDFMARALYDPVHGYYGAGKARVGRAGDFFTNVSVGPLFGRLLARQIAEMWQALDRPKDFAIVEQGAHGGDCARDVLEGLRAFAPECLEATSFWIIEPGTKWQSTQRKTLASFEGRVQWVNTVEALPSHCGVHYSNELLDAFPVHRVVRRAEGWRERIVAVENDQFIFRDGEIKSEALRRHLGRLPPLPDNYETEVNLETSGWMASVAARLSRGFVLIVDYGYPRAEFYRLERTAGTLSAYSGHQRVANPLEQPGEVDLTAHVDFTTVAEAAREHGMKVAGFCDQQHFIVGLGQLHFPPVVEPSPAAEKELREFKTLMHPELMGKSFRVLCLAKDAPAGQLSGFRFGAGDLKALAES